MVVRKIQQGIDRVQLGTRDLVVLCMAIFAAGGAWWTARQDMTATRAEVEIISKRLSDMSLDHERRITRIEESLFTSADGDRLIQGLDERLRVLENLGAETRVLLQSLREDIRALQSPN